MTKISKRRLRNCGSWYRSCYSCILEKPGLHRFHLHLLNSFTFLGRSKPIKTTVTLLRKFRLWRTLHLTKMTRIRNRSLVQMKRPQVSEHSLYQLGKDFATKQRIFINDRMHELVVKVANVAKTRQKDLPITWPLSNTFSSMANCCYKSILDSMLIMFLSVDYLNLFYGSYPHFY